MADAVSAVKGEIRMKTKDLEPEVLNALQKYYKLTVDLESLLSQIATATTEEEEIQLIKRQCNLLQERLTVRKFLDDKLLKKS